MDHASALNAAGTEGSTHSFESQLSRLRALRSAWGVLAPSGLSEGFVAISESGRALTDRFDCLQQSAGSISPADAAELDQQLDAFESSMRDLAAEVPVAELRATLPGYLSSNRAGLLDLLDVLIGRDPEIFERARDRIGAIDYLVTLLCIGSDDAGGSVRHDPVSLTPRVQALCDRAEQASGELFPGIEAEFFAASAMETEDLREELQLRTLRSRKAELGPTFFVPRILRAVVTYNAALLGRVAAEIVDSGDWGFVADGHADPASTSAEGESVFASNPLREIAASVRLRAMGKQTQATAGDAASQIAWALDFDYLSTSERKALHAEDIGTQDNALGTAILVGLICRSLAVLAMELQAIGISPDQVSDGWIAELSAVFQEQINQSIADDAYKIACALSELKNKFLSDPLADQFRQQKETRPVGTASSAPTTPTTSAAAATPTSRPPAKPKEKAASARDLVKDALEQTRGADAETGGFAHLRGLPLVRMAQGAFLAAVLAVAGHLFLEGRSDLDRWTSAQLEAVSPYLVRGSRSQSGVGPAFTGRIDEAWKTLPDAERRAAAEELVLRLRELGLSQIMIFGPDDQVYIQALGAQPTRTL